MPQPSSEQLPYREFSFERSLRQYPFPSKNPISPKPVHNSQLKQSIQSCKHLPQPRSLSFQMNKQQQKENLNNANIIASPTDDDNGKANRQENEINRIEHFIDAEFSDIASMTSISQLVDPCQDLFVDLQTGLSYSQTLSVIQGKECQSPQEFRIQLRKILNERHCGSVIIRFEKKSYRINLRRLKRGRIRLSEQWPEVIKQQIINFLNE